MKNNSVQGNVVLQARMNPAATISGQIARIFYHRA